MASGNPAPSGTSPVGAAWAEGAGEAGETTRIGSLEARLADERSRRVLLVSHCLLNQNVRYLGGAFRPGMVPEALAPFICEGDGLYQMPCPEQAAWGGVSKKWILRFHGSERRWAYRFRAVLLPLFLAWTRWRYRLLAARVARHVADYRRSGYRVVGILGVGDSPSCGVRHTLDLARALPVVASLDVFGIDRRTFDERVIRGCAVAGEGLYIGALRRALERRHLTVPLLEYRPPLSVGDAAG
ncbi:MAG TPA: hypothetical protein VFL36_01080 [Myxococcales bacterium]|nr:hypothetical protein [Myxococcales bacterium]